MMLFSKTNDRRRREKMSKDGSIHFKLATAGQIHIRDDMQQPRRRRKCIQRTDFYL